jgi:hypothetical protein
MSLGTDNIRELLDFAAGDGYAFIELRDPEAALSLEDCELLSSHAREKGIEVLYEIHKDLFSPDFQEVFERAVVNTTAFGKPGILRSILSWSEFTGDENKTGWTQEELDQLAALADQAALTAMEQHVQFVLENIIEPWSANPGGFGLQDFFGATSRVGLQFDTANPFLPSCRGSAQPDQVAAYLEGMAGRWFTTHLKCGKDGAFQPVLSENPLPFQKVFELMSSSRVMYAALELLSVDDPQTCFDNHRESIAYLASLDIIQTNE